MNTEFSHTLVQILGSLGVVQGALLSLYFLSLTSPRRLPNLLLALILAGLTIRIGKSIFNYYLELMPWQRNLGLAGMLIVGPAAWFYGLSLRDKAFSLTKFQLLHFAPSLLFAVASTVIPNAKNTFSYFIYASVMTHVLVYLLLGVSQYKHMLLQHLDRNLARWYSVILTGLGSIWFYYILVFVGVLPYYIGGALFYAGLIYFFSYLLLKRHSFALEKYAGSKLASDEAKQLLNRVERYFDEEQIYLKVGVSLGDVATSLGISTHDLSRTINQLKQQNFSEFVNTYRIALAKSLLTQPSRQPVKIATIASEVGFGNVTSFNQAFKHAVGQTPSEFKKSAKPD